MISYLHSVLALDPASNVGSPGNRSSESHKNILRLNPGTGLNHTRRSEENSRLNAGVNTGTQGDHGYNSKGSGSHLGHDRSKNLGWGVFTFPGHVLGHEEGGRRLLHLRGDGDLVDAGLLGNRGKSRGDGHDGGEEDEGELGHFDNIFLS